MLFLEESRLIYTRYKFSEILFFFLLFLFFWYISINLLSVLMQKHMIHGTVFNFLLLWLHFQDQGQWLAHSRHPMKEESATQCFHCSSLTDIIFFKLKTPKHISNFRRTKKVTTPSEIPDQSFYPFLLL